MNINKVIVGILETNCYILEKNNKVLIIDPGDDFYKIKENVLGEVVGILLTHNHFDHVGAVEECKNFYKVNVYDYNNLEEGFKNLDCFNFFVKYNLGHTLESISFIFNDIMFVGDFIFKDGVGRWDLGGNYNILQDSIRELLSNEINYKIYPGHGDSTFLNDERDNLKSYI